MKELAKCKICGSGSTSQKTKSGIAYNVRCKNSSCVMNGVKMSYEDWQKLNEIDPKVADLTRKLDDSRHEVQRLMVFILDVHQKLCSENYIRCNGDCVDCGYTDVGYFLKEIENAGSNGIPIVVDK